MIQLPNTPFIPIQLNTINNNNNTLLSPILNKRLSLSTNISDYTLFTSQLETYLNFIYKHIQYSGNDSGNYNSGNYTDVIHQSANIIISNETIPWILPSIINNKHKHQLSWSLKDEIIIVIINLTISYALKAKEIIHPIITNEINEINISPIQSLWVNCFKIFKKSLQYINFITKNNSIIDSNCFETSNLFINFINHYINVSIQSTFLIKTTFTLKNLDFDIMIDNSINYSTISRISIYIKNELNNMLNILKNHDNNKNNNNKNHHFALWIKEIEILIKYFNAYIGVYLSIENYKQDKIGKSIGFLNYSIENISKKSEDDENNNIDKNKKIDLFKKKLQFPNKSNNNNNNNNKKKPLKLKLNNNLINSLQKNQYLIFKDIENLFQLINLLNLKYNLENNNLKFDEIPNSIQLIKNYLPSGRSVPIDSNSWIPIHQQQEQQEQSGYY